MQKKLSMNFDKPARRGSMENYIQVDGLFSYFQTTAVSC